MAGCEKCWSEASRRTAFTTMDKVEEYHKVLKERDNNPCYLDCPDKHPDHYSYAGCPSCGFRWGT